MRVAIAQRSPVLLNRRQSLEVVESAIVEAADAGAGLVAFGETFVPGYPIWLEHTDAARFDSAAQKELHARYVLNAVDIGAGHLDGLRRLTRDQRIAVVLGVAERDPRRGQSLFATAVSIDAEGEIRAQHRKLVPTYEERLAWSHGDAHGLTTWPAQEFTVGVLNCWENWMPLARAALYGQGETLHVAIWPGSVRTTEQITRFIAREGRSYVVSASGLYRREDIPTDTPQREALLTQGPEVFQDGGSCIAGPDGEFIVPPAIGEESLLVADIELDRVAGERQNFDAVGHYSRPELMRMSVDKRRFNPVEG